MNYQLHLIRKTREHFLDLMNGLSLEALNTIPDPFKNNIIWNFGHILVSQQILCYRMSGLEMKIDPLLVERYRKGSKPEAAVTEAEVDQLKAYAFPMIDQLERDVQNGMFKNFNSYTTSMGVVLNSVEDAVAYDAMHESMHYGYALAMRKLV